MKLVIKIWSIHDARSQKHQTTRMCIVGSDLKEILF